jgi:hypothetical protein
MQEDASPRNLVLGRNVPESTPLHRRRRDGFVFWLCFPRLSAGFASDEWVRTAQPRSSAARPSWTQQDPSFFRTGRLWQKEGTVPKIRDGIIKISFSYTRFSIRPHWRKHGHLIRTAMKPQLSPRGKGISRGGFLRLRIKRCDLAR